MESTKFLTASLLTAGLLAGASTADAALVAHWSFDNDFTADTGGSGFDLTAINGATAGDAGGMFGNAATFERANSEYAFTGGDVIAAANSDFSYSAWFNFDVADITGSSRYFVLETTAGDTPSGTSRWTASAGLREGDDDGNAGDTLDLNSYPDADRWGNTAYTANAWQNIIVTYDADGGTGTGLYTAYLNGTSYETYEGDSSAVGGLVIGGHRVGAGRNFDGQIDDVAFWDNVLTAQEITDLQTNAVPEPGSLALLAMGGLLIARRRRA